MKKRIKSLIIDDCKFCKKAGALVHYDKGWYQVICSCGARGPIAKTGDEAIWAWNKRS